MNCNTSHDVAEHMRKAGEHIHSAARAWSDHIIKPEVRTHLRSAARSVLMAGLAALEAAEPKPAAQTAPAAAPAQPT